MIKEEADNRADKPLSMHPHKFAVWLFIVAITMVFAALTSAYVVRRSQGNWLDFEIPDIFWVNSVIIVMSSVAMQWGYFMARKDRFVRLRLAMVITTLLGILFLAGQFYAWDILRAREIYLQGNPSGSFLYMFTGLHAFHLVSGVVFLIIMLISTIRYKVHSRNMVGMEMCTTYWHFLGGLWLYLFIFLLVNH